MVHNRNFVIIFFLILSALACVSVVFIFRPEGTAAIISTGLGIIMGIVTCGYIQFSNTRLMGNSSVNTNNNANRWMLPSVLVGIVLARYVIVSLQSETQNMINGFVFAWVAVFSFYIAFWAWRYMSKGS